MMIVIVNVHLIAIPLPVAAPIDVISCYDPVGAIVEDDIAGTIVDGAGNKALADGLQDEAVEHFKKAKAAWPSDAK